MISEGKNLANINLPWINTDAQRSETSKRLRTSHKKNYEIYTRMKIYITCSNLSPPT